MVKKVEERKTEKINLDEIFDFNKYYFAVIKRKITKYKIY